MFKPTITDEVDGQPVYTLTNAGIQCPQCVIDGVEAKVYIQCGSRTSAGCRNYYEGGAYHEHDPNVTKGNWSCNNGHAGTYRIKEGCTVKGCDWNGYKVLTTDPTRYRNRKDKIVSGTYQNTEQTGQNTVPNTVPTTTVPTTTINKEGRISSNISPITPESTVISGTTAIGGTTINPTYVPLIPQQYYTLPLSVSSTGIQVKMIFNGVEYSGILLPTSAQPAEDK